MQELATGLGQPTQRLAELDQSIQIAEIQLEAVEGFQTLRESLPQILDTIGTMKTDLKGDPVKLSDFVDVKQVDGEFPYIDVKAPRSGDLTSSPADVIATAGAANETLTGLAESLTDDFAMFADHQSGLLSGLKDLQAGLDRGSELFGKTETAIKRLEQGAELFGHLFEGEISDDKLMEAFTNHLTMLTDVLKPLTDVIPGLSDFFQAYVDGVKSMGKDVETLRLHKIAQENVLNIPGNTIDPSIPLDSSEAPQPAGPSLVERLKAKIAALREEREAAVEAWLAVVGVMATTELRQLEAAARRLLAADGVTFRTPAEIKAAQDQLTTLRLNYGVAAQSDQPEDVQRAADLDQQIKIAEAAEDAASRADDEARKRFEAHMADIITARPQLFGPTDLAYLKDHFDGEIAVAADELEKKLPKSSVGGAVLPYESTDPNLSYPQRLGMWLFNDPRMVGLGLLGLVAATIVGFLLFGGGDEEPDLIAAGGDAPATATAAATPSSEATVTDEPTATATEEVVFGELAPQHFSICTDGTVLSGTVKVDANGDPVLDGEGNTINADTGESFVCR
jgi:hypothetical protein